MAKKHLFSLLKIKVRPKGLHNFAFCILIFAFSYQSMAPNPSPLAPNAIVHKDLRADKALYISRDTFTNVMSALQIHLFMQNKAKFKKVKSNVNNVLTKDYDQMDTWSIRKNEPKRSQNKPKTNPIQSQYKPNTNPIQTQFKPKQTQFQRKIMSNLTINTRPNPFGYYANRPLFAADSALNPPCLAALLSVKAPIFAKKKLLKQIPDKAGAALCRFVYIRKSLYLRNKQGIISADFRLRIENKYG
jgi:hypothetical protein